MNPAISIIVPVYNVEKYLSKCIQSILNQSYRNFELILVNDGSTDGSGKICNTFKGNDSRIKVVNKQNKGLAAARNTGLEIARGEYIGFVDSDDWIERDMFSQLYNSSITSNADISIIGIREVDELGNSLGEYHPNGITLSEVMKRAYAWNKLFKRSLFFDNELFFAESRAYEDLELIPKLFVKAKRIIAINEIGYNYLKRNQSITSSRDEKILDNLWAYVRVKEYLKSQDLYLIYEKEFEKAICYFRSYYINILYDYPTKFFLKNFRKIFIDFKKINGLGKKNGLRLGARHVTFCMKRTGLYAKMKIGMK